ncbi:MAG: hypothetical protein K2P51_00395 [Rhabdochlamydiaceae bacterium]|nr:hypothetical protein [Rhabdochlamydiaceae bacterium]
MAISTLYRIYQSYHIQCQVLKDPSLSSEKRAHAFNRCERIYYVFKTMCSPLLEITSAAESGSFEILKSIRADVKTFHARVMHAKREFLETAVETLYEKYERYRSGYRSLNYSHLSVINRCALFEHCERTYQMFKTSASSMLRNEFASNLHACKALASIVEDVKKIHAQHKQHRHEFLESFMQFEFYSTDTPEGIKMWLESASVTKMLCILNTAKMIRQAEKNKVYAIHAGFSKRKIQKIERTIRTHQSVLSDLRFVFG